MAEYKMQMIDFKEQLRQYEATVNSALEAVLADYQMCIRDSSYAVERTAHRIPVIAGAGSNDTAYAVELCKEAKARCV